MSGTYEVTNVLRAHLVGSGALSFYNGAWIYNGILIPYTSTTAPANIDPALIAFENRSFLPIAGSRFYRATFLPGIPVSEAVGIISKNRHVGIFQIDVFDPAGEGDGAARVEAERIVACFKRGTVFQYSGVTVTIDRAYTEQGNNNNPDWYQVPVRIQWRADIIN